MIMYIRLEELRIKNNFSKQDVANLLEIPLKLYVQYEDGKKIMPVKYLLVLARTYNTSIDYIINDTDTFKPHRKL